MGAGYRWGGGVKGKFGEIGGKEGREQWGGRMEGTNIKLVKCYDASIWHDFEVRQSNVYLKQFVFHACLLGDLFTKNLSHIAVYYHYSWIFLWTCILPPFIIFYPISNFSSSIIFVWIDLAFHRDKLYKIFWVYNEEPSLDLFSENLDHRAVVSGFINHPWAFPFPVCLSAEKGSSIFQWCILFLLWA